MEEEERERLAALQEAEEIRKDKHRKLEEEREKMRQGVREKVRLTHSDPIIWLYPNSNRIICSNPVASFSMVSKRKKRRRPS